MTVRVSEVDLVQRLDQNEKISLIKHFLYNFEKQSRFFTIFTGFISILQTFSRSGKLLGKFQDFQESVRTL